MPLKNSTPIYPSAIKLDFSPMARAAQAKAHIYTNLGNEIKMGMEKAKEKREKKLKDEAMRKFSDDLAKRMGIKLEDDTFKNMDSEMVEKSMEALMKVKVYEDNAKQTARENIHNDVKLAGIMQELAMKADNHNATIEERESAKRNLKILKEVRAKAGGDMKEFARLLAEMGYESPVAPVIAAEKDAGLANRDPLEFVGAEGTDHGVLYEGNNRVSGAVPSNVKPPETNEKLKDLNDLVEVWEAAGFDEKKIELLKKLYTSKGINVFNDITGEPLVPIDGADEAPGSSGSRQGQAPSYDPDTKILNAIGFVQETETTEDGREVPSGIKVSKALEEKILPKGKKTTREEAEKRRDEMLAEYSKTVSSATGTVDPSSYNTLKDAIDYLINDRLPPSRPVDPFVMDVLKENWGNPQESSSAEAGSSRSVIAPVVSQLAQNVKERIRSGQQLKAEQEAARQAKEANRIRMIMELNNR